MFSECNWSCIEVDETEWKQGVLRLWLNRPEKRNAFDERMIAEMTEFFNALNAIVSDEQHRQHAGVLVIAGRGKHFCAGADLGWMQRSVDFTLEENKKDAMALTEMLSLLHGCPLPTVTMVHGACYGGGLGLVCCSDIAIGLQSATFCLSEVKLGLVPAVISPYVVRAIGHRQARRFMLTAEVIPASKAEDIGLLHVSASEESAGEQLDTWVAQLLANGPESMRTTKAMLSRSLSPEELATLIAQVRVEGEAQQRLMRFLAK